ncbi:MAG: polysaccharide biosynthesis/export family protein [Bacteroidota bacterium]
MFKIYSFLCFACLLLSTSCISNKDIIYLQGNSNNQQTTIEQVVQKPYRVQSNDVISIKIKALDQKLVEMFNVSATNSSVTSAEGLYFDGYTVDEHGNIRIPVLGEVPVLGLTLDEIRVKIEKQLLTDYFNREADIFVIAKLAGLRYTVNGEIRSPGTKTLLQEKVTILEAIANCGDITITGNRKDVMVVRQFPHGTEMHSIDLTSVDAIKSPYYYIQPNDYVYVKPIKQKNWGVGTNGLQSFTTIISAFSLILTTYLLIKK